ncbi:hypothetical protein VNO77_27745 [Canavalia gladiata]|uniref:Uncharacterized protein n=1 Tax=Canavalia gladiata TaxID=3824 RepID=A0AAN9KXG4_CANGL
MIFLRYGSRSISIFSASSSAQVSIEGVGEVLILGASLICNPEPSVQEQALAPVRHVVDGCMDCFEYALVEDGIILDAVGKQLQRSSKLEWRYREHNRQWKDGTFKSYKLMELCERVAIDMNGTEVKPQIVISVQDHILLTDEMLSILMRSVATHNEPITDKHKGISTWPGRLILTDHALYFEVLHVVYDEPKDMIYQMIVATNVAHVNLARDPRVRAKSHSTKLGSLFEFNICESLTKIKDPKAVGRPSFGPCFITTTRDLTCIKMKQPIGMVICCMTDPIYYAKLFPMVMVARPEGTTPDSVAAFIIRLCIWERSTILIQVVFRLTHVEFTVISSYPKLDTILEHQYPQFPYDRTRGKNLRRIHSERKRGLKGFVRKVARSLLGERFCVKIALLYQWREKKIRSTEPQILLTQAKHQLCEASNDPGSLLYLGRSEPIGTDAGTLASADVVLMQAEHRSHASLMAVKSRFSSLQYTASDYNHSRSSPVLQANTLRLKECQSDRAVPKTRRQAPRPRWGPTLKEDGRFTQAKQGMNHASGSTPTITNGAGSYSAQTRSHGALKGHAYATVSWVRNEEASHAGSGVTPFRVKDQT